MMYDNQILHYKLLLWFFLLMKSIKLQLSLFLKLWNSFYILGYAYFSDMSINVLVQECQFVKYHIFLVCSELMLFFYAK